MANLETGVAATRTSPLSGVHGGSAAVRLTLAEPAERISLRARAEDVAALSRALAIDLPIRPKTSSFANGRTALWLGPDEWLVIDEGNGAMEAACKSAGVIHSAVDISHRNTAIFLNGPGSVAALGIGCPQDLSVKAFPVGACTRTVFGKIEIVILRTAEDGFRVECWRSFSDYAFGLLSEGAIDAAFQD